MSDGQPVHVFRVDKFVVPDDARDEFVRELRRTHNLLAEQPGFVQDSLLEQSDGPGEYNFVTIVEWENHEALETARDVISALHERSGFDREELFTRHDIRADIAAYALIGGSKLTTGGEIRDAN
ncbi:antibiotic biosynthesis monooxygenase (plasmid) [Salinigranum rubrum]|uniref:Antibiotic biosynthesis monooxygenase n=1 Tax=Salinigranum rubrum TaxID=755307 RepID=A0A2I8VQR2_9EURY|nr:antibiotic biosynthesis monooxygenase family protein [Salinigranum rubrum]AUV84261.1 antibiotic biosynthesis monooxygenase [Salinigranum rubrum]